MDKSTGKQVKTAGGNLLGVTLSEPSDEVTRELKDGVDRGERDLLTDATCFATTTMEHQTYLDYLTGTETVSREFSLLFHLFILMYINLHPSLPLQHYIVEINHVTWPGIVIDALVTHETFENLEGVTCDLYKNVKVQSQPDVVYQVECCGTDEGNCCVNADQFQGQRHLKGCIENC